MNINVGLGGILTLVFVVLKLTHVIAWSWLWVLSPLWISIGAALAIAALIILGGIVAVVIQR